MKYCLKCNISTVRDEAIYCPCCGERVVDPLKKCYECEQEIMAEDKHCIHCGIKLNKEKT